MNKLTEIKEKVATGQSWINLVTLDDAKYLLSLLEEKDKALAFYADENNYLYEFHTFNGRQIRKVSPEVARDCGTIARKALNTSSNSEGE